ncbi:MAG: spiro-SPASM protein [Treponema sp.]|nr:spiro-SPASM protein [Treponema sp.]
MKTIVILFAGTADEYAYIPIFDGKSASELALSWAEKVPNVDTVAVLSASDKTHLPSLSTEKLSFKHIVQESWTISLLLKTIAEISVGFDAVVYGFIDAPFYSDEITNILLDNFKKYGAEYCFADGYPAGLAPEILHHDTANILAKLAKDENNPVTRTSIFDTMKIDINAFEIETEIAPKDLRSLRVNLYCGTKRDTLQCERLYSLLNQFPNKDICTLIESSSSVLRTLPAFYDVQIVGGCKGSCIFCPYPIAFEERYAKKVSQCIDVMSVENFSKIIDKIADFSSDAVVSLSLWGEPLRHKDIAKFVEIVLSKNKLSVLIETTGEDLSIALAKEISDVVLKSPLRKNEQVPINWIVAIDAADENMYKSLHGNDGFAKAVQAVEILLNFFPNAVYPQFLRMNENELHMEPFYRYWKEKCGQAIIQKYDSFAEKLPLRKVADLTPIHRNVCWHIRRDMSILLNGDVPLCREYIFDNICGNIFEDKIEDIWHKGLETFECHLNHEYKGLCKNCDEYYTFNF